MSAPRDGMILGVPEREYHRGPELSSTAARQILDSPARFAYKRMNPDRSEAMDVGTLVHTKILGTGAKGVEYPPEHLTPGGNASTKAATKAWEEEQRTAGNVVISPANARLADAMAEAVLNHDGARRLLETPGNNEVSLFATDPETGVRCRARFDRLCDGLGIDIKTTSTTASPRGFGAAAAKYGYPIQEAWYADLHEWVTGERVPMRWVVVEKFPPFLVAVHEFTPDTRLAGMDLARQARTVYAECVQTDTWPAYGTDVIETQMPSWWLFENDDQEVELVL